MLNFRPRGTNNTASLGGSRCFDPVNENLYLAARALPTEHGQIHIQRAGLQSVAQHGIFHTPLTTPGTNATNDGDDADENDDHDDDPLLGPRKGYRVAITARITYPNSIERLTPYLELYKGVLGPEGNLTMPR